MGKSFQTESAGPKRPSGPQKVNDNVCPTCNRSGSGEHEYEGNTFLCPDSWHFRPTDNFTEQQAVLAAEEYLTSDDDIDSISLVTVMIETAGVQASDQQIAKAHAVYMSLDDDSDPKTVARAILDAAITHSEEK